MNWVNVIGNITWFGFAAWRIVAVVVLVLGYGALKIYWARAAARREHSEATDYTRTTKLVYTDAPTVRLSDTQRIDRLQRVVSLKAGQHADLKDLTFGRLSQLRVELTGIEQESGEDFAHVRIELGGAAATCGAAVQELSQNDFLIPRAGKDDQRSSVLYFCGKNDAVSFLQVKVRLLDAVEQSAAIDVLHVRGRWAA